MTTVEISPASFAAVIFDMDGVVTDTARIHEAAWRQVFNEFLASRQGRCDQARLAPFTTDDYLRHVDGKPRDAGVASFFAARGISLPAGTVDDDPRRETVWGVANRKNQRFLATLRADGVRAFDSTLRLVCELQSRAIGTAIISASRNCGEVLDAAGIGDLFEVRVDGIELERLGLPGKPAPAIFLEAAHRLGVEPARAVVIEDAVAGIRAARAGAFGLTIGVDRGGNAGPLRNAGADAVVGDLAEVAVATHGDPVG